MSRSGRSPPYSQRKKRPIPGLLVVKPGGKNGPQEEKKYRHRHDLKLKRTGKKKPPGDKILHAARRAAFDVKTKGVGQKIPLLAEGEGKDGRGRLGEFKTRRKKDDR